MASRFSDVSKRNSVVMITACLHGGASASMAWGIAASAAADGRTTVYIDLDHQNHVAVNMSETTRGPTLIERPLRDKKFLVEVIQKFRMRPDWVLLIQRAHCASLTGR